MSFKVDPEFHRMYKRTASDLGMTMRELLTESFNVWRKSKAEAEKDK